MVWNVSAVSLEWAKNPNFRLSADGLEVVTILIRIHRRGPKSCWSIMPLITFVRNTSSPWWPGVLPRTNHIFPGSYQRETCRIYLKKKKTFLKAFNFNGQSLKLPDECGPTISDHTKRHCRNKRSMITPEAHIYATCIGESLFTLFVSLTYAYHYLMTVIQKSLDIEYKY